MSNENDDNKTNIDKNKLLQQVKEIKVQSLEKASPVKNEEDETDLATYVAKNKWQVYKEIANIFTDRSKKDNSLKEKYSIILIIILVIQLIAMNVIFILRGCDVLKFDDTTFNIFITATIAEVFSLVTIIVKSLFEDKLTNLLSNILTEAKKEEK